MTNLGRLDAMNVGFLDSVSNKMDLYHAASDLFWLIGLPLSAVFGCPLVDDASMRKRFAFLC